MTYSGAKALLNKGVSRPTLYRVQMPRVGGRTRDYLEYFVKATSIPEVSLRTVTAMGHEKLGVARQQPIAVVYAKPLQLTVIGDSDFEAYKALREWFDETVRNANPRNNSGNASQRMQYYDSYVEDITLIKLENPDEARDPGQSARQGDENAYKQPLEVTFHNAYPIRIGSISLGSDMYDSATEFTVEFTYETYNYQDG